MMCHVLLGRQSVALQDSKLADLSVAFPKPGSNNYLYKVLNKQSFKQINNITNTVALCEYTKKLNKYLIQIVSTRKIRKICLFFPKYTLKTVYCKIFEINQLTNRYLDRPISLTVAFVVVFNLSRV